MFLGFCRLKLSSEPAHIKARDDRFDVLKALAMWFVVVWHVCTTPDLNESCRGLCGFIVGFNMPLFFVISGYFSQKTVLSFSKTLARCMRYATSMACYSVVIAVVMWGIGTYDSLQLTARRMVSTPIFGWWFMWSLMYSLVLLCGVETVAHKFANGRLSVRILVTVVAYLLVMLLPDSLYQVKYFKFCFPFFVLGYACRETDLLKLARRSFGVPVWIGCLVLYLFYSLFLDGYKLAFYWDDFSLLGIISDYRRIGQHFVRNLVAVAGVVSIAYPILLLPRSRLVSRVANWGRTTMGVYFMHQIVLSSFILPIVKVHEMSVFSVLFVATLLMLICHSVVCSFGGGHR